jgi:hypothetical protein
LSNRWATPLPIITGPEALRPTLSRGLPFSQLHYVTASQKVFCESQNYLLSEQNQTFYEFIILLSAKNLRSLELFGRKSIKPVKMEQGIALTFHYLNARV